MDRRGQRKEKTTGTGEKMNKFKKGIRAALIILIVGSLGYLIAQEMEFSEHAEPQKPVTVKTTEQRQPDHIKAYYFHGNFRCPTCRRIEEFSKSAINDGFPEELKNKTLTFEVINVEEPWNKHFIKDYGLYTKSLVIVSLAGEDTLKYKNLAKVWELTGSREKFHDYVQNEVKTFLSEIKR
jgi:hypothetical protein